MTRHLLRPRIRPAIEALEERQLLAALVALTPNNELRNFDYDGSTAIQLAPAVAVTGLQPGETLQDIDYRFGTGQIIGFSTANQFYEINPDSGRPARWARRSPPSRARRSTSPPARRRSRSSPTSAKATPSTSRPARRPGTRTTPTRREIRARGRPPTSASARGRTSSTSDAVGKSISTPAAARSPRPSKFLSLSAETSGWTTCSSRAASRSRRNMACMPERTRAGSARSGWPRSRTAW